MWLRRQQDYARKRMSRERGNSAFQCQVGEIQRRSLNFTSPTRKASDLQFYTFASEFFSTSSLRVVRNGGVNSTVRLRVKVDNRLFPRAFEPFDETGLSSDPPTDSIQLRQSRQSRHPYYPSISAFVRVRSPSVSKQKLPRRRPESGAGDEVSRKNHP